MFRISCNFNSLMNNFTYILEKLKGFVRKYYLNELLRGSILFVSFGLLYLLFTAWLEYMLWLDPVFRTVLFWCFIAGESYLLFRWILIPVFHLFGLRKGISNEEAARLIGKHFPEVDDRLINLIQLKSAGVESDLLLASIEQKSIELKPIPFRSAIHFKKNWRTSRYLSLPFLLIIGTWLTGNDGLFTQSFNRVIKHQTVFVEPAPFRFRILNESLEVVEDQQFDLKFTTDGSIVPEEIQLVYNDQHHYIRKSPTGIMEHKFESVDRTTEFYFEANGRRSPSFELKLIKAPKIMNVSMEIQAPAYTGKEMKQIDNTGNARVLKGSKVLWKVNGSNAESIEFMIQKGAKFGLEDSRFDMKEEQNGLFTFDKEVLRPMNYKISSSNKNIRAYENLFYKMEVIEDEYPGITVRTDMDSIGRGAVTFYGRLNDDYGLSRLQVVAKNMNSGKQSIGAISIGRSDLESFVYSFPDKLLLDEGESYEIYFEVFDNDGVSGAKKSVSKSFYYKNKSEQQIEQELMEEQEEKIKRVEDSEKERKEVEKELEKFSDKLKSKGDQDWNDQQEMKRFVERNKQYREMMEKLSDEMIRNLEELEENPSENLEEKRQELEDRWKEQKEQKNSEELLKELDELGDKLEKEGLLERVEKLKEQSNQEKRSLERILELTKRFYIERKVDQLAKKLDKLGSDQEALSEESEKVEQEQDSISNEFQKIKKELDNLRQENESLKEPMSLFESTADEKLVDQELKEIDQHLENSENEPDSDEREKASEKQKSAGKRMKEMAKKMESAMMSMEMDSLDANIEDLQQILKNLVHFSHDQEDLMMEMKGMYTGDGDFPEKMKEQIKLKEHFEHIDDSLYALSMKLVMLSADIDKDLSAVHYNLNRSLENMAENRIEQGRSNQQYTMTSANNLADLLSDLLDNLQNNDSPSSGKGKSGKQEFSLPDIIEQQKGMQQKMEEGMKKGEQEGKRSSEGNEKMTGEQYQMYQQQKWLKDQLENLLQEEGREGEHKELLDNMEKLERDLLEKGFDREVLERMKQLEYQLLELEKAMNQQDKDPKRESKSAEDSRRGSDIESLDDEKMMRELEEMMRRQNLEFRQNYKIKVKKYFNKDQ